MRLESGAAAALLEEDQFWDAWFCCPFLGIGGELEDDDDEEEEEDDICMGNDACAAPLP
jgi:hypothetical protein